MEEQTEAAPKKRGCVEKVLGQYIESGAINDLTDEQIAKIHGLKVSTVGRFRRKNGIKHRRGPKVRKGGNPDGGERQTGSTEDETGSGTGENQ